MIKVELDGRCFEAPGCWEECNEEQLLWLGFYGSVLQTVDDVMGWAEAARVWLNADKRWWAALKLHPDDFMALHEQMGWIFTERMTVRPFEFVEVLDSARTDRLKEKGERNTDRGTFGKLREKLKFKGGKVRLFLPEADLGDEDFLVCAMTGVYLGASSLDRSDGRSARDDAGEGERLKVEGDVSALRHSSGQAGSPTDEDFEAAYYMLGVNLRPLRPFDRSDGRSDQGSLAQHDKSIRMGYSEELVEWVVPLIKQMDRVRLTVCLRYINDIFVEWIEGFSDVFGNDSKQKPRYPDGRGWLFVPKPLVKDGVFRDMDAAYAKPGNVVMGFLRDYALDMDSARSDKG